MQKIAGTNKLVSSVGRFAAEAGLFDLINSQGSREQLSSGELVAVAVGMALR